MQKNTIYYAAILICIFFLLFFSEGCDVQGARDPFSYAPSSSHSIWNPPREALLRLVTDDRTLEMEDYTLFSKDKPLSLAEVVDIALYNNPNTKQSWANARVSAAMYGQSLQNFFVQAEIDAEYTRFRAANFFPRSRTIFYDTIYDGQLVLSYLLLDFGQTRWTSDAALQSLYNADWTHNRTIQATIQTIMTDYYDYLYQKKLLFAAEQDVINGEVTLAATQEKFNQGIADVSDVSQATTFYLQQKLNVVNQTQSVHASNMQLINDMGLNAPTSLFFENYPDKIDLFELDQLNHLIDEAIENRPDLIAAEANIKSNESSLIAAERLKYPVVTSQFDVGRTYHRHGINDDYDFAVLFSLTFPVFQGYFIENTIKKARANLELAVAQYEQVKLQLYEDVSNFRSNVNYARESYAYANNYLAAAEENYKVNLQRYKVGTGTIVDVINAQTAVADARAKVATAQNNWYTSIANLAFATGMLLPPKMENRTPYLQTIENKESVYE